MHKALGRGLESLLHTTTAEATMQGETVATIPIDKIRPNRYQARMNFNEDRLKELSQSIKQHGLAQPLLVSPSVIPGEYELIAGERRWRASQMAGLKEVAAIVKKIDDRQRFELSLIENIQREDLNPIEEAKAYRRLSDEFNLTQEDLARFLGKDRSVVANAVRLLTLPPEVQEAIVGGVISPGHGRILAGIDDRDRQKSLAERILREKLTVRDVEKIAAGWKEVIGRGGKKVKRQDAELVALAEELQRRLGTKVTLAGKPRRGKIEIHYYSLEELGRIAEYLKGKNK